MPNSLVTCPNCGSDIYPRRVEITRDKTIWAACHVCDSHGRRIGDAGFDANSPAWFVVGMPARYRRRGQVDAGIEYRVEGV